MIKKVRISGLLHVSLYHHTIMLSYYHAIIIAAPVMPLYYYNSCDLSGYYTIIIAVTLSCYHTILLSCYRDRMGLELG